MQNPHAQVTQQGLQASENRDFDAVWDFMRKHGGDLAYQQFLPSVNNPMVSENDRPQHLRRLEQSFVHQYIDDAFRGIDRTNNMVPRGEESYAGSILGDDKVALDTRDYASTVKETRGPLYDAIRTRNGIQQAFEDNANFDLTSNMETPGIIHRAVG
jgi:hypothetical protein